MNWCVITKSDLEYYLVAAQVEAIRTAAVGVDQTDRFDQIMPDIASRVRSEVQGRKTNGATRNYVHSTANSVPPELKWAACWLIIQAMQVGIPGMELSEDQRKMISDANDFLKRVASGDVPITNPDAPLIPPDVQQSGGVDYSVGDRVTSRTKLSGL